MEPTPGYCACRREVVVDSACPSTHACFPFSFLCACLACGRHFCAFVQDQMDSWGSGVKTTCMAASFFLPYLPTTASTFLSLTCLRAFPTCHHSACYSNRQLGRQTPVLRHLLYRSCVFERQGRISLFLCGLHGHLREGLAWAQHETPLLLAAWPVGMVGWTATIQAYTYHHHHHHLLPHISTFYTAVGLFPPAFPHCSACCCLNTHPTSPSAS